MVSGNGPEGDPRADQFRKEYESKLAVAGIGMVDVMYDVVDTLTASLPESLSTDHKADIEKGLNVLQTFVESKMGLVIPRPRAPREIDRIEFLPGQHKGVSVELVATSGEIGIFNMYGGLRDAASIYELRDTDRAMLLGRHHANRTDRILSQPVHLNWHVIDPRLGVLTDVWLEYHLNRDFQFSRFIYRGNTIDLKTKIDGGNQYFQALNERFLAHANTLITYIPSA